MKKTIISFFLTLAAVLFSISGDAYSVSAADNLKKGSDITSQIVSTSPSARDITGPTESVHNSQVASGTITQPAGAGTGPTASTGTNQSASVHNSQVASGTITQPAGTGTGPTAGTGITQSASAGTSQTGNGSTGQTGNGSTGQTGNGSTGQTENGSTGQTGNGSTAQSGSTPSGTASQSVPENPSDIVGTTIEEGDDTLTFNYEEQTNSGECGPLANWSISPNGILSIDGVGEMNDNESPWAGRTDITSIEIGQGITKIGANAFAGLTNVTTIRMECSKPVFGDNCFGEIIADVIYQPDDTWTEEDLQNYGGLLVWIEKEEQARGEGELDTGVEWLMDNDGTLILSGSGEIPTSEAYPWDPYKNEITKIIIGDEITSIGNEAFDGIGKLTDLELGSGVRSIGRNAFARCQALENLTIPSSVEELGCGAFASCRLVSVTFSGDAPTVIGGTDNNEQTGGSSAAPFDGNDGLTIIYPGENATWSDEARASIGGRRANWISSTTLTGTCGDSISWTYNAGTLTISGNGEMEDYNISFGTDGISLVYDYPWKDFASTIRNLVVEEGITGIGNMAFAQCSYLTNVSLPDTLQTIGKNAFNGCASLQEITIPENTTVLEEFAFSNCSSLADITLGKGLTAIENDVFKNDTALKNINYTGSEKEWTLISISSTGNSVLYSAKITF